MLKKSSHFQIKQELVDIYDGLIKGIDSGNLSFKDAVEESLMVFKVYFDELKIEYKSEPYIDVEKLLGRRKKSTFELAKEKNFNLGCLAFLLVKYESSERQAYSAISAWLKGGNIKCSYETVKKAHEFFEGTAYLPKKANQKYFLDLYGYKIEEILIDATKPFPIKYSKAHKAFEKVMKDYNKLKN